MVRVQAVEPLPPTRPTPGAPAAVHPRRAISPVTSLPRPHHAHPPPPSSPSPRHQSPPDSPSRAARRRPLVAQLGHPPPSHAVAPTPTRSTGRTTCDPPRAGLVPHVGSGPPTQALHALDWLSTWASHPGWLLRPGPCMPRAGSTPDLAKHWGYPPPEATPEAVPPWGVSGLRSPV